MHMCIQYDVRSRECVRVRACVRMRACVQVGGCLFVGVRPCVRANLKELGSW